MTFTSMRYDFGQQSRFTPGYKSIKSLRYVIAGALCLVKIAKRIVQSVHLYGVG